MRLIERVGKNTSKLPLAFEGVDDAVLIQAMSLLSDAHADLGNHHDALSLIRRVLEARRRTLGNEHADTLLSISRVGAGRN